MALVKVARTSDILERRSKLVSVEGVEIALWRVDGQVYAINNVCPHQHFSRLHQGYLEGIHLTCPMHGWTFRLDDGCSTTGDGKAKVYGVVTRNQDVYIEMP